MEAVEKIPLPKTIYFSKKSKHNNKLDHLSSVQHTANSLNNQP